MSDSNKAEFISSYGDYLKCVAHEQAEFAFIGRSNVGKSSLINMLAGVKDLAKTSSTPGKTQTINHFKFPAGWYLVDLPGYGYAKSSKTEREKWDKMVRGYLENRKELTCLVVLVDARLELQRSDLEFINQLGESGVPFVIAFTKADKLTKTQLQKNIADYKKRLAEWWEELPRMFITSSTERTGRDELMAFFAEYS
ncbi:MAG: ribosome biogenesis GTP-binding protein YihA/YsxC [Bacteroidota bacterium]|mgnify:CR=1 FL=1|jgi:GTP-binding protein